MPNIENSDLLWKLHSCLLDILDEIDRICRKHDIQYFLDSGTALGAIRHAGFIPWDDDADVGMLRNEYERFIQIAKDELSPRFFLQTRETDAEYSKFSAKIRINDTFFPERRNEGTKVHQGIFVDVFPFDYISDNVKIAKKEIYKTRKMYMLWGIRHRHPCNESVWRKIIRKVFLIIPENLIEETINRHFKKYTEKPTNTLVSYTYKMNSYMILLFKRADMFPSCDVLFEGHKYEIMNNWDAYLKTMYGNYMELPPKDKQVWHFEGEIRFE